LLLVDFFFATSAVVVVVVVVFVVPCGGEVSSKEPMDVIDDVRRWCPGDGRIGGGGDDGGERRGGSSDGSSNASDCFAGGRFAAACACSDENDAQ
jgi:hypothetical protein